jgi:hypothetical protein
MLTYADFAHVEEEHFGLYRWHGQRWNDHIATFVY